MTLKELRGYYLNEARMKGTNQNIFEKVPVLKNSGSSDFAIREVHTIEYVEWLEKRFLDLVTP